MAVYLLVVLAGLSAFYGGMSLPLFLERVDGQLRVFVYLCISDCIYGRRTVLGTLVFVL